MQFLNSYLLHRLYSVSIKPKIFVVEINQEGAAREEFPSSQFLQSFEACKYKQTFHKVGVFCAVDSVPGTATLHCFICLVEEFLCQVLIQDCLLAAVWLLGHVDEYQSLEVVQQLDGAALAPGASTVLFSPEEKKNTAGMGLRTIIQSYTLLKIGCTWAPLLVFQTEDAGFLRSS
jgi:hypothetical protein